MTRIAETVEDLKIGQTIVWWSEDKNGPSWVELTDENIDGYLDPAFTEREDVVIFKEAPPEPILVSDKTLRSLQEWMDHYAVTGAYRPVLSAVERLLREAGLKQ